MLCFFGKVIWNLAVYAAFICYSELGHSDLYNLLTGSSPREVQPISRPYIPESLIQTSSRTRHYAK